MLRSCLALITLTLAACGGGGGGAPTPAPPTPPQSFEGIWSGDAVAASGLRVRVIAAVRPSGETVMSAPVACHFYSGTSTVLSSGASASMRMMAYASDYCYGDQKAVRLGFTPTVPGGGVFTSTFNATGTVVTAQTAVLNYTTGYGESGQVALAYWPVYARASSLAKVTGNYANGSRLSVSIDGAGRINGTETVSNGFSTFLIAYSGQVSVIDPARNLYRLVIGSEGGFSPRPRTFDGYAVLLDEGAGTENGLYLFAVERQGSSPFIHYWIKQ